jgi:hypothetical protein
VGKLCAAAARTAASPICVILRMRNNLRPLFAGGKQNRISPFNFPCRASGEGGSQAKAAAFCICN